MDNKVEKYEEFQRLYLKEYGIEISLDEAREKADNLLRLYKAVYKPKRRLD